MNVLIRKVLPEEAYDYTICHIACWRAAYKDTIPEEHFVKMSAELEERTVRMQKSLEAPGETEYYCVTYNEKMIGRLIFGKSWDEDKPDVGMLGAIYLLEEFWDKGYGREMMCFALNALKRLGYSEIILWVLEKNNRARRFYDKFGFVPDGAKKDINLGTQITEMRYILNIA